MKTCSTLLLAVLLIARADCATLTLQDGVMIQKIGANYIFIFPAGGGRIAAVANPAGQIRIGGTIQIKYSLKMLGRARFIGLEDIRSCGVSPRLDVKAADKAFGFLVKDSNQPTLRMTIEPSFSQKVKQYEQNYSDVAKTIAREGNLEVIMDVKDGKCTIVQVLLN